MSAIVQHLPHAIVITGGIATGKSSVTAYLKKQGYQVIDIDIIAHQILMDKRIEICQLFGDVVSKDNQINRQVLGDIVFTDAAKRKQLEQLLHPSIFAKMLIEAQRLEQSQPVYFLDMPLYYETQQQNHSRFVPRKVVLIYCPNVIAIERLQQRNQLSKTQAEQRLNSQIDIEQKKAKADLIIDNSGDKQQLMRQLQGIKYW